MNKPATGLSKGHMHLALLTGLLLLVTLGCRPAAVSADRIILEPVTSAEILANVRAPGAKATLVNIWASWCGPCRAEFPDLMAVTRKYRTDGLRVILVSVDLEQDLPAARQFLAQQGVNFPSYFKAEKDHPFVNTLNPRWTGAIPATWIYDHAGNLAHFWEGAATAAEFEAKIKPLLKGDKSP